MIKEGIEPIRISDTYEEGIFISYRNHFDENIFLYLEIYNDGGVGYIINSNKQKKILGNEDIKEEEIIGVVKNFVKELFK